ncbi:hypothetical protein EK0264_02050 [Epidermidibacterium keratini]|uniref:Uncharacterized protein n=1 Tax=Epidermidibacterium keratini TaxID=1891644 RepID=A0A7L4YJ73_9ACTN|nr:hypothetical protein [Epidermidibacterium keratini]QHB99189.1 hypothetical protein EK0264_02050 [Epidermidibacterium keratini]
MLIDCNSCTARPAACEDCVMTVLLGPIDGELELDDSETQALDALADGGLVPPLRMVPMLDPRHVERASARGPEHRHRPDGREEAG